jgi:hypothetical protein
VEPDGVDWALAVANRNFLIHQYDEIDRRLTWLTLSRDLPAWGESLQALFAAAQAAMHDGTGQRSERVHVGPLRGRSRMAASRSRPGRPGETP